RVLPGRAADCGRARWCARPTTRKVRRGRGSADVATHRARAFACLGARPARRAPQARASPPRDPSGTRCSSGRALACQVRLRPGRLHWMWRQGWSYQAALLDHEVAIDERNRQGATRYVEAVYAKPFQSFKNDAAFAQEIVRDDSLGYIGELLRR